VNCIGALLFPITTSHSPSIVTVCLFHAVSEILRDENNSVATAYKKLVEVAKSLERPKKSNFRSIIYGHSSSNPENLVKSGPVDVETGENWFDRNR